jgi:prepilin-type N-terminal cleavage/methylation domain-containing protein
MSNKNTKLTYGFTLVELMISIAVFSSVMVASMGSIFVMLNSNRKSEAVRTILDNMSYTMDDMVRAIRFGSAYSSLKNDFVATGDVKIRIVIVPLKKYPNSVFESSALLCATQQKHGEAMHLALGSSVRDRKTVIALATKLGLNIKTFPTCLGTKETKATLKEQADLVTQKNVTLIPALDLNGEMKVGLQSYADLRGWILDMLKR